MNEIQPGQIAINTLAPAARALYSEGSLSDDCWYFWHVTRWID